MEKRRESKNNMRARMLKNGEIKFKNPLLSWRLPSNILAWDMPADKSFFASLDEGRLVMTI